MCNYCTTVTIIEHPNEFKCILCQKIHQVPSEGFKLNETLNEQLLKQEPEPTEEIKQFKLLLDSIGIKLKQAEFNLFNGDYLLKEHCRELRRQVQLAKETKVDQLEKLSDEMLNQIDMYEKERLNAYQLNANKQEFTSKLNELKIILDDWNQKLNDHQQSFSKQIDSARNVLSRLAVEEENLKSFIFNDKLLDLINYQEQLSETLFGKLAFTSFDCIDFNNLNKIDMNPHFDRAKVTAGTNDDLTMLHFELIDTLFLKNNCFVVFLLHRHLENSLAVFLFDDNKAFIKTSTINASSCESVYTSNNKMCINFTLNHKSYLAIMNESLDVVNQIETDKQVLIGANKSFIFVYSKYKKQSPLIFYDWSLNLIRREGQRTKPNEAFYYPNDIYRFEIKNDLFYSFEDHLLNIVNKTNGMPVKSVDLNRVCLFHIDQDNRLILIDEDHLIYLNLFGILLKKIKLNNFPDIESAFWSVDFNNNLHILDEESYWLSIRKPI